MADPLHRLTIDDLRRRTSAKWRAHPSDVLPLWVAEMDVPLAPPVAAAINRAVELGDTGYPAGPEAYAAAFADFATRRWGWRADPERMRLVPDVMTGAVELLGLVTGPGDAVVVNPPVYPPFFGYLHHVGRRVVEAPLGGDGRLDLDALEQAFAAARSEGRPAAFLLCSPHNPTGAVHTVDELAAVAALATHHGVRVIADEIHAPVVRSGHRFVPYLTVAGSDDAFVVTSASKGWSLAGCKAGMLLAGPAAATELATLPEIVGHGASHLGVVAHTAAFAAGGPWLDAVLAGLERNLEVFERLLGEHLPDVRYQPGAGTYLAWLDVRDTPVAHDPAAAYLRAGVACSDGASFGPAGAGHVRLNLATSPAVLEEAVVRMGRAR